MEVQPRELQNYLTADGSSPFEEWLNSLRDNKGKATIKARLKRVAAGNLGDYRSVGEGVYELRVMSYELRVNNSVFALKAINSFRKKKKARSVASKSSSATCPY